MLQNSSDEEEDEVDGNRPLSVRVIPFDEERGSLQKETSCGSISTSIPCGDNISVGRASNISVGRASITSKSNSPTVSVISISAEEIERLKRKAMEEEEEKERKLRIQLYVFVSRCIAYPFTPKQPSDMIRRQTKVTVEQLEKAKDSFQNFLTGVLKIQCDDAFKNAINSFFEVVVKSVHVGNIVKGGGWTMTDFQEIFKKNVTKRIYSLPEMEGVSKTAVINSWMEKFDSIFRGETDSRKVQHTGSGIILTAEGLMNKDQLYEMFQEILLVKKHQHQILYNALQLDNSDEQAAQVRRELDFRAHAAAEFSKKKQSHHKCITKSMDLQYGEELKATVDHLKACLESVPVTRSIADSKYLSLPKRNAGEQAGMYGITRIDMSKDNDSVSLKPDLILSFPVEVTVMELKGLTSLQPNKVIYCTMEIDGADKLQTDRTDSSNPHWDCQGDFKTNCPLPLIKIKLYQESQGILSLDDKELAKVTLNPTVLSQKTPEWHTMVPTKNCLDKNLTIKIATKVEKSQSIKHCGYLYAQGKNVWKKWKKRYFILVQVSQYRFVMCSYQENKPDPTDFQPVNDFTVDYCEPLQGLEGGKYFFQILKVGDETSFATDDETDRLLWIQAIYRATGQQFKPELPNQTVLSHVSVSQINSDIDKARRHGLAEFVQSSPERFDHNALFKMLQRQTLEYRLKDRYTCLGWFSPSQMFVLDEYSARYGVRGCKRHLFYLNNLLDYAESGVFIDPTLFFHSFSFCSSHVHGNRPDRISTVLKEERDEFLEIKDRLKRLLETQLTNFRQVFPFGRPESGLKTTLSLLERVMREVIFYDSIFELSLTSTGDMITKDVVSPVPRDDMNAVVRKCLEYSALNTYLKMSEDVRIEDSFRSGDAKRQLDGLMQLAELCIEVLQQIEEYHAEAFSKSYSELLVSHAATLWSLFSVDLDSFMEVHQSDEIWDSFSLFQLLNEFLISQEKLAKGIFHSHLCDIFAPVVVHYIDMMEISVSQSVHDGFENESWRQDGAGCASSKDLIWKLDMLQSFVGDLNWPDDIFLEHLKRRVKLISMEMIHAATLRTSDNFDLHLAKCRKSTVDCIFPDEMFVMINVIVQFSNWYGSDENSGDFLDKTLTRMTDSLLEKLLHEIKHLLSKLSRYDQNRLFSSLLSSLKNPSCELSELFIEYTHVSLRQLRHSLVDKLFFQKVIEMYYLAQMKVIEVWLSERIDLSLHPIQVEVLTCITNNCYGEFEDQNLSTDIINKWKHLLSLARGN